MLYNESTGKPKADVFSLESLIAWLETKPADEAYCYGVRGACLAGQFNTYCGRAYPNPFGGSLPWTPFDETLETIAQCGYRTFGAAIERARALQQ